MFLVASSFRIGTQGFSSVSDNNNFVAEQSPGNGYGYRAYGELSHFVYCILQRIKKSESLLLVEKWEDYMLPNHSSFVAIDEEHFLIGTRIHAALEKMSSSYLRRDIRCNAPRFLEEFRSTILSTVAARPKLGQEVSCFCPEIILGGDDHSAFFLYGRLLDGLVFGKKDPTLRLVQPSSSLLSGSSASWSVIPRGCAWCREHPGLLRSLDWISESQEPVPGKLSH